MRSSVLLATVAAVLGTFAGTANATSPGGNGLMVLPWWCYADGDSYDGCYLSFAPDGGNIRLPATFAVPEQNYPTNAAWSPDGRRLAFDAATGVGTRAIFIVNRDGTGLRQVGRGDLKRYNPAWSPDGTKLAFTQDNGPGDGSGDVYTFTTSGGSLKRLTTHSSWEGAPDFSPDGTRIAYNCSSGGKTQICQMTPTGGSKTNTTARFNVTSGTSEPSWSPDSRNLTFSMGDRVYVMTRAGGSLRQLRLPPDGSGTRAGWNPVWSPDGRRIAFEQWCGYSDVCFGVRSMRLDGSDAVWLAGNEDGFALDPGAWQAVR